MSLKMFIHAHGLGRLKYMQTDYIVCHYMPYMLSMCRLCLVARSQFAVSSATENGPVTMRTMHLLNVRCRPQATYQLKSLKQTVLPR
jgi:hypothetical protein